VAGGVPQLWIEVTEVAAPQTTPRTIMEQAFLNTFMVDTNEDGEADLDFTFIPRAAPRAAHLAAQPQRRGHAPLQVRRATRRRPAAVTRGPQVRAGDAMLSACASGFSFRCCCAPRSRFDGRLVAQTGRRRPGAVGVVGHAATAVTDDLGRFTLLPAPTLRASYSSSAPDGVLAAERRDHRAPPLPGRSSSRSQRPPARP